MELYFYNDSFQEAIEEYQLSEIQLRYTGRPKECIMHSTTDPDRYSVLAIEKDQLMTYLDLHKKEGVKPYSNNDHSILIRAFSTDFRFQGNGYAQKTLGLLPDFVQKHFPEINELVLAVNVMNKVAQGLYKKCGFVDNGERRMGKKGELIMMSKKLGED